MAETVIRSLTLGLRIFIIHIYIGGCMHFYTNVDQIGDAICVRGFRNGRRFQDRLTNFKPKLFLPKTRTGDVTYRNLFGEPLEVMEFGDIGDARDFMKKIGRAHV